MNEFDADIFSSLVRHSDFQRKTRRIISDKQSELRTPHKVSENAYIELHLSANEILNYAKLVVEKFEGMETECSYRLKPRGE